MKIIFPIRIAEIDLSVYNFPKCEAGPGIHPFTPVEVRMKVKNFDNTAPGPGRLTYKHWLGVDPDGKDMAATFNAGVY